MKGKERSQKMERMGDQNEEEKRKGITGEAEREVRENERRDVGTERRGMNWGGETTKRRGGEGTVKERPGDAGGAWG